MNKHIVKHIVALFGVGETYRSVHFEFLVPGEVKVKCCEMLGALSLSKSGLLNKHIVPLRVDDPFLVALCPSKSGLLQQ